MASQFQPISTPCHQQNAQDYYYIDEELIIVALRGNDEHHITSPASQLAMELRYQAYSLLTRPTKNMCGIWTGANHDMLFGWLADWIQQHAKARHDCIKEKKKKKNNIQNFFLGGVTNSLEYRIESIKSPGKLRYRSVWVTQRQPLFISLSSSSSSSPFLHRYISVIMYRQMDRYIYIYTDSISIRSSLFSKLITCLSSQNQTTKKKGLSSMPGHAMHCFLLQIDHYDEGRTTCVVRGQKQEGS